MKYLNNLSFRYKIFLLVLLPLAACLYFSLTNLKGVIAQRENLSEIKALLSFTVENNNLVHELQKERGITAGFLGSQGKKFKDELASQRQNTQKVLDHYRKELESFKSMDFSPELTLILGNIDKELDKLDGMRQRVDQFSIELGKALGYYTNQNKIMLSLSSYFNDISPVEMSRYSLAYFNLIQAKERAGIERAVVSNALTQNKFSKGTFQTFISLLAIQETFLDLFKEKASAEVLAAFEQGKQAAGVKQVLEYRTLIKDIGQEGPFNRDAGEWFKSATERINFLKHIEDTQSHAFQQQTQQLLDKANTALTMNIVIVILATSISLLVAFGIFKNLMSQLTELNNAMLKVKNNNDLTANSAVLSQDELGNIALNLNDTLSTFSKAIHEINDTSVELTSSASQSAATTSENVSSLIKQRDETAMVATATEQVSSSVREVSRNTTDAMSATHKVNSKAIEGQQVVTQSLKSITRLVEEVTQIGELISGLHNTSVTISNVIDVIKDIADQTNLLALNAAIEAARAGEQGRGFAVVADEVRTLAKRTQDSTVEIEDIINQLQREADNANNVIEGSQERAKSSIDGAHQIEESLADIVSSISNVNVMIEQIASASEEQVNVVEEINHNVNDIENKSQQVTQGAQELNKVAEAQVLMANNLQALANRFKV